MKITNDKLASDRKQLQEIIKPGGVCGKSIGEVVYNMCIGLSSI